MALCRGSRTHFCAFHRAVSAGPTVPPPSRPADFASRQPSSRGPLAFGRRDAGFRCSTGQRHAVFDHRLQDREARHRSCAGKFGEGSQRLRGALDRRYLSGPRSAGGTPATVRPVRSCAADGGSGRSRRSPVLSMISAIVLPVSRRCAARANFDGSTATGRPIRRPFAGVGHEEQDRAIEWVFVRGVPRSGARRCLRCRTARCLGVLRSSARSDRRRRSPQGRACCR